MKCPVLAAVCGLAALLTCTGSALPMPVQAASFRPYSSTIAPYTITYPASWTHAPLVLGSIKADAFLSPQRQQGFADNVNVIHAAVPVTITSNVALLHANEAQLVALMHQHAHTVGTVTVGTAHLPLITWNEFSPMGHHLAVMQAFLYRRGWGWTFTLTTLPADQGRLRPIFVTMLHSFHAR